MSASFIVLFQLFIIHPPTMHTPFITSFWLSSLASKLQTNFPLPRHNNKFDASDPNDKDSWSVKKVLPPKSKPHI